MVWTQEIRTAFSQITPGMSKEVILDIPDVKKRFVLRVYASDYAVGAVLEQYDSGNLLRPVAFYSRNLSGDQGARTDRGQRGWSTREKEMYGIISTLHKHQSWIALGTEIEILTDHCTLKKWYQDDPSTVSGRLGRRGSRHEFLSRYPLLQVRYTPKEGHIVPDVLSRWAYQANTAAPDSSIHGSEADATAWEATEVQVREQENNLLGLNSLFADCCEELLSGCKPLHRLSEDQWVIRNKVNTVTSMRSLQQVQHEHAYATDSEQEEGYQAALHEGYIHESMDARILSLLRRCQAPPVQGSLGLLTLRSALSA